MEEGEEDFELRCEHCGEEIEDIALERGYMFSEDKALCYACAIARGGAYDEHKDRWLRAPDLSGLSLDGDPEFGLRGAAP